VGWYIENIDISPPAIDILVSVSALVDIVFSRYIDVLVTSEISVIVCYFIILFNINLKTDDNMSKIEYRIWQCDNVITPRYISTSPKQKSRNNIDVIDYFAGDNETYE